MTSPRFFAILPAAGRSVRMGRPKLLLPWQGRTVWEHVLDAWKGSTHELRIVAVVHPEDVAIADLARKAGVDVVVPGSPPEDMKASVRLGLAHHRAKYSPVDSDAWVVAPSDMPRLRPAVIDAVLSAYNPAVGAIVVPEHAGRRGHPVLFPWKLAGEVDALGADEGLNRIVARHEVVRLPLVDAAILEDLDTPEDYQALESRGE
jgi:molybdenum cofactor cytidylyltransferase